LTWIRIRIPNADPDADAKKDNISKYFHLNFINTFSYKTDPPAEWN